MELNKYDIIYIVFSSIFFVLMLVLHIIFWPLNIFNDELIQQHELYYNSSVIMDISTNCDNKSNNILGYFGGIPEGRTYTEKPRKYCPYNPMNFLIGKCKVNPWFDYDICDSSGSDQIKINYMFDKNKCVTVNEVKFKYYNYFKGVHLCSNNEKKLNYYTLIKNSTNTIEECLKQKNMKVCGILDDLNQIVCLHENYSCPINDIIFNQNKEYSIKINETIINYDNIKINDNLYIHFTNKNINKKIISSFNISLGEPCSHMYISPKRNNMFTAFDFIYCNESNKTIFEYIYSENATKFMKDNSLYPLFNQFVPSKFNYYNINLFSSFYFGLNKTCILEYNFNENSFKNYLSKFSIFKGFYITFTIFYFLFFFSMTFNAKFFEDCEFTYILIKVILLILSLFFMFISHILFQKISSLFDCRNTNIDFIQSYQKFRKNKKFVLIIEIIIYIIFFCFILFELYFAYIKHIEYTKNKNEEKFKEKEKILTKLLNEQKDSELEINL